MNPTVNHVLNNADILATLSLLVMAGVCFYKFLTDKS